MFALVNRSSVRENRLSGIPAHGRLCPPAPSLITPGTRQLPAANPDRLKKQ